MDNQLGSKIFNVLNYTVLTIIGLVTLLPFIYVVIISFTDPTEYLTKSLVLIPRNGAYLLTSTSSPRTHSFMRWG